MSANSDIIFLRLKEIITQHLLPVPESWIPLKVRFLKEKQSETSVVNCLAACSNTTQPLVADREPLMFKMNPSATGVV